MHTARTRMITMTMAMLIVLAPFDMGCGGCGECGGDGEVGNAPAADGGGAQTADGSNGPESVAARVRQLIEQERYDDALSAIPTDAEQELEALRERATMESVARDQLRLACMETDGTDLEAVHEACVEITPTSRYHDRGCCRGAAQRYGEARLSSLPSVLESDGLEHALASALDLADDETMPTPIRERAGEIAVSLDPQPDADVGDGGEGGESGENLAGGSGGPRSGGGGNQTELVEEAFAARALQRARAALDQGNQHGCIGALRSAPRTAPVVSLLITCYASAGNLRSACEEARRNQNVAYARRFNAERCR